MPKAMKNVSQTKSDMGLDGFEQIFAGDNSAETNSQSTTQALPQDQVEKLLVRLTELIAFSVDQRMENARMASQLIENQRQLIATQQIVIRLMEKSIELTKHVSNIEEKLPTIFELPRMVDSLKDKLIQIEGLQID